MQVIHTDVFPTRIWVAELPELAQYRTDWVEQIALWRSHAGTAGRSNRKGWNSDKTVLDKPEFAPLREAAMQVVRQAFKDMQLSVDPPFRMEGWVNLHDPGGFNMSHIHPNVLLSGTYYLQVPEGAGPIVFRDPRPGPLLVPFPGRGVHCGSPVAILPKPGQLIFFPNWLEHQVEVNEGQVPRVSIGLNALAN